MAMCELVLSKGKPYPLGLCEVDGGVFNLAAAVKPGRTLKLNIYDRISGHREGEFSVSEDYRIGDVFCMQLSGIDFTKYTYSFSDGAQLFADPYARHIVGCGKWGTRNPRALFKAQDEYDWEGDRALQIPFSDSLVYTLHVRGFTKHASSGVNSRGCFEGVIEKIDYLKELGINQVQLLPAYDFDEIIRRKKDYQIECAHLPVEDAIRLKEELAEKEKKTPRFNYWGFADSAFYFAPKASYSAGSDPARSMKDMVKALHRVGIEVVMQFYFPQGIPGQLIVDCLRFWALEYHIDGACVMGPDIPADFILSDPVLSAFKLYLWGGDNIPSGARRHVASMREDFMCSARRFLKSDDGMLRSFADVMADNPREKGVINFITNYYGFTLMDLVSYDRKHNEDNGEDNRDGGDNNLSWNCGVEGPSRKKAVSRLRSRQIRNALSYLYFSAGIPMLMAGDEFGNSQKGNNNPYCQDNDVAYLDWKNLKKNKDIFEFVKELISFRRKTNAFRSDSPRSMTDENGSGYPNLSYHGEMAWYPRFESYSRSIGCMYVSGDEFIYTAFNSYWIEEQLALPKLPKDKNWHIVMRSDKGFLEEPQVLKNQDVLLIPDRCTMLLAAL